MAPMCGNRIPMGHGRAETYCILPAGHDNSVPCTPDPAIKAKYPDHRPDHVEGSKDDGRSGILPEKAH